MNGRAGNHHTNLKQLRKQFVSVPKQRKPSIDASNIAWRYSLEWEHAETLVHAGCVR